MKNIGLLIPQLTDGGAERVVSRLSYILQGKYNVYVILYDGSVIDYPPDGFIIDMNLPAQRRMMGKMICFMRRVLKLRRIKKQYQIDATLSFLNTANIINILSRKNDKIILSIRNYLSVELKKGLYNYLYLAIAKTLYKSADAVIAVSKLIAMDMQKKFGLHENKVYTVYNPFDVESIREMSLAEIDDDIKEFIKDKKIVVTAGRLSYQKGFWHLLKAFKIVKESVPNAGLIILGKGDLEGKLKNLAAELGISKDVFFAGYRKNVFSVFSKAEVYVMSSLFEGFPNALVEAMACGLPVVSTDCKSGPREILCCESERESFIKEEFFASYGVLIPPLSECENYIPSRLETEEIMLFRTIIKLLEDQNLNDEYRRASIRRASDFGYERCYFEINEVLIDLIGGSLN